MQMLTLCTSSFITSGAASAMDCAAAATYAGVHRFAGDSPKYLPMPASAMHMSFWAVGAGITLSIVHGNKEPSDLQDPIVIVRYGTAAHCTVKSLLTDTW